ncbi:MAG TPA: hypothetical protein VIK98_07380 [Limnochordales bacterium]
MNRINLLLLLDKLEQMVQEAPRVPIGNRALINASEMLELIAKIRETLPEEVKRADRLAADTERLLQQGQSEAERLVREAEAYAARLVSESEVLRRAQAEAKKIIEEAQKRAKEIEEGADAYADGVLRNLQEALERTLRTVKKGRSELQR